MDGSVNQEVFEVASRSEARLLLSTARRRSRTKNGPTPDWKLVNRERISHQLVGGITEKIVDLCIYQPSAAVPIIPGPQLAQEVPRDASTVLSLKEHAFFRLYLRPR
jgi:hypothetical protein